jgi:molecular chaperone GrpE
MSTKKKAQPEKPEEAKTVLDDGPGVNSKGALENELRSTIDRLQRLQAEFENYKKRALRDAAVQNERTSDRIILDFLPLYDNLERAFQSLSSNEDVETFVTGVEQIFAQFRQLLEIKGVTRIEALNQPFDPQLHEAMLSVPSSDVEKNVIIEEFMPGYVRDERVLRPSKVSVSQGPQLDEEEPE